MLLKGRHFTGGAQVLGIESTHGRVYMPFLLRVAHSFTRGSGVSSEDRECKGQRLQSVVGPLQGHAPTAHGQATQWLHPQ